MNRSWQRVALAMFAVGWGANQFSPMLLAYRAELGISTQTRALLFALYAVGLIPALLVGGAASDRWGRRAVVVPFVAISPVATVLLIASAHWVPGLAIARLLAGVSSGVVFGAASAWVSDLSVDDPAGAGARRAALALSAGFGLGPLVTGLVAEVATYPLTVPYLPHVVLGVVAAVLLLPVPGPRPDDPAIRPLVSLPAVTRGRRFLLAVAPAAPWVFGCASISIAFLPSAVDAPTHGELAFAGVLTGVTLGTGVLVQPLARRLDDRRPLLAGRVGLLSAVAALLIGLGALEADSRWLLLVAGPVFGAAYGCGLVSGLREAERLAPPEERGAVVAAFYGLTYLGFFAPYLLGAVGGLGIGPDGALLVAVAVALGSLAVVSAAGRSDQSHRTEPASTELA
ncbi:MFS transporter [Nocardioides mangrovi]|uniref:MFS transporter n=1 Tax=Nocardioides mangrovi TaxID=2874580 RepID=A0ABS7UHJ7_9ACTN|nr:MFS transporter [Nocardioides mangrovi]MBZ5740295.1 MFS transporter [Nocardioides mangrovi]